MASKLLRGTFILTIGTILSKILGLFYVIPFTSIVGKEGATLYQYSYISYTIFISIATAGVPLAVSKFVSKYNALEEYAVGRRLFRSGLVVMLCTGFIAFLILYFAAPTIAVLSIPSNKQEINLADVIQVIRAVSFALIIVPIMSLIRGYFQGHQSMGPSAVSQVVEQIVRVVFLLVGSFIVLSVLNGEMVTAVSIATFAAFIGAAGGLIVLIVYWVKRKENFNKLLEKDKGQSRISFTEIYKEILLYSIPFVFVGIANSLFQFIDQMTFNRTMVSIGLAQETDFAFSALNYFSHKLVIIPVSLATSFALTIVPAVTATFIAKDRKGLHNQLNQVFQVLLFLTLPAVMGLSLLGEPFFTVFYGYDAFGSSVLSAYAPVALLFALYSVTAAILQGINEQRFTILSLLVGLLVKLSFNIPLIKMMETKGAILATALGYGAAIAINLIVIKIFVSYRYRFVFRRSLLIVIFTAIMYVGAGAAYQFFQLFLSTESRSQSIILIVLTAFIGALIYGYLAYRSRLIYFLFGSKAVQVLQILRLRKYNGGS
ncbi:polysaccharide biosynthesis protein [Bacillaceae bacterium Marseille-Q3522]|nr:polysaccharide biosynthesis protein [Bacillaceae bacterium Marseille-Q3522]